MTTLAGRTALVTGVSGAIGGEIARVFGREGATVVGTFRSRPDAAAEAVADIPAERRVLMQAEFGGGDSARDLWAAAVEAGEIDTVVVNAAAMAPTPLEGDDDEWDAGWQRSLQVNVIAASTLMKEAARTFAERGAGSIIAISSWAALQGSRIPDLGAYAASKAGLRSFAQTLARAHARTGVRVYTIAPGVVDGGMGTADLSPDDVHAVAEGLAMGRHVAVSEIAELAAFLASDRCPSATGSTIDLNGASYIR